MKKIILALMMILLMGTAAFAEGTAGQAQTLSAGASGEEVRALQERLVALGYLSGEADGQYGAQTRRAVKAFQRRNGLDADGIAGPKTLARLYADDAVAAPEEAGPVNVLSGELPLLVNLDHPVDEFFEPADLVLLKESAVSASAVIKYPKTRGVQKAVEALSELLAAAKAEGLGKWQVSAGYRSWEDQDNLLKAKINHYLKHNEGWSRAKARNAALRTVAQPGASEHHLGLAFDVNVKGAASFAGTKQCAWLHQHCWDYGFIVRYQPDKEAITGFTAEAWHIRYVGVAHARYMRDQNLCLEEYLQGIEAGTILPPTETVEEDVMLED